VPAVQTRVAAMSQSETTSGEPVSGRTSAATRVLVADANYRTRARRYAQLAAAGCQVSLARTGFEAIVKASCQIPDLILLDDSLGQDEAEETRRLLATCPSTAHIRVLRLTVGRRVPQRTLTQLRRAV
jgi:CheY-like chemotaxis protein